VRHRIVIFILFFIVGCIPKTALKGFDSSAWKNDANGCNGIRKVLVDEIINRKDELVGLGQEDIFNTLGKPNRHELYSRHKKAFVYVINGSADCLTNGVKEEKLVIRFDALERTKEVILYK